MPSSSLEHYLRFPTPDLAADDFVHTAVVRHGIIGNVNHIADQVAQTRVKWVLPTGQSPLEPEVLAVTSPPTLTTGTLYRIWQSDPFDLNIKEDGTPYSLRVLLRGARSAGTGTVTFRLAVGPEGRGGSYAQSTSNANVGEAASASATHAWLTLSQDPLLLTAEHVTLATRSAPVRDSIGGVVTGAPWLRCTAEVWGKTTDSGSVPQLSGLVVEEFYEL